jgi:Alw26I/Eco31I/Esp3I family type II restriction endonuclease
MARSKKYGKGSTEFLEYAAFIVAHPNYRGMPDVYCDDGTIQWEAPSNRASGKHKDTHQKRRDWWAKKAREIGVSPTENISRTVKAIHPTMNKPCKSCGRILDLRYSYPSVILQNRIRKLPFYDDTFVLDPLEHITDLVVRLAERYGNPAVASLPFILKAKGVVIPSLGDDLESWIEWIDKEYVYYEPSILSPGAMSNAPDRLDGFHSQNLCCRSTDDKGRHKKNLQSYATDRRVFEYWVGGNWIAANDLVGHIRSSLTTEDCLNGHDGPCTADHIGPISLGFNHRPEFQLLCTSCNSAKNNRMTLHDVQILRQTEKAGNEIVSWYCAPIWHARNSDVCDEETALRLSKIMRDNRHTALLVLNSVRVAGYLTFLTSLLGLEYADFDIEFTNLRVENHMTRHDGIELTARTTKYALEQKTRRIRVALSALSEYASKPNRNALFVLPNEADNLVQKALQVLTKTPDSIKKLDAALSRFLKDGLEAPTLSSLIEALPVSPDDVEEFAQAKKYLDQAMQIVGTALSDNWEDDRYKRASPEDDIGGA